MTSVQDVIDCPQCKNEAFDEFQTRGQERDVFCPFCGYSIRIRTLRDRKKGAEVTANVERLLNRGKVDEALKLSGRDFEWTKKMTTRQKAEYLRKELPIKFWKMSKDGKCYLQRKYERVGYGSYSIGRPGAGAKQLGALPTNKKDKNKLIERLKDAKDDGAEVRLSVFEDGKLKYIIGETNYEKPALISMRKESNH